MRCTRHRAATRRDRGSITTASPRPTEDWPRTCRHSPSREAATAPVSCAQTHSKARRAKAPQQSVIVMSSEVLLCEKRSVSSACPRQIKQTSLHFHPWPKVIRLCQRPPTNFLVCDHHKHQRGFGSLLRHTSVHDHGLCSQQGRHVPPRDIVFRRQQAADGHFLQLNMLPTWLWEILSTVFSSRLGLRTLAETIHPTVTCRARK